MARAIRPIFLPSDSMDHFVDTIEIEFEWFMGMAMSQRKLSMRALHKSAEKDGYFPLLEISTRSDNSIGKKLSAFNLLLIVENRKVSVEAAFQGSKVFENGGPYNELYFADGMTIKKDQRLRKSGNLIGFEFCGDEWSLEPKTLFYDWLYITALSQNKDLAYELSNYKGFSDIAFNPKKSINCQAHSAALYISLKKRGQLSSVLNDKSALKTLMSKLEQEKDGQQILL